VRVLARISFGFHPASKKSWHSDAYSPAFGEPQAFIRGTGLIIQSWQDTDFCVSEAALNAVRTVKPREGSTLLPFHFSSIKKKTKG